MQNLRENQIIELLTNHKVLTSAHLQMKLKCTGEFGKKVIEELSKRKNIYSTYFNGSLHSVSMIPCSPFTEIQ